MTSKTRLVRKYIMIVPLLLLAIQQLTPIIQASSSKVATQSQSAISAERDSALAAYYEIYASGLTFEDRIDQATKANGGQPPKELEIVKSSESEFQQHVHSSTLSGLSPQMLSEVANADLIIMGTPLDAHSLPIQDRTFLFTQHTVRVERVISNDRQGVLPGDNIIISRGGGQLTVNGVVMKAVESAFDDFRLNQLYIFLLRTIPNTGTYRALGSATFVVENGMVSTASHLESKKSSNKGLDNFLSELDAAVARKHSGKN